MRFGKVMLILVLVVLFCGCAKLPGVTKIQSKPMDGNSGISGGESGVGLYYALPLTVVKIEMPLSLRYYTVTGKNNKDIVSVGVRPVFSGATITATSTPDPEQLYKISLDARTFSDMSYSLKRSAVGQLQTIGCSAVNRTSDVVAEFVRYATYIGTGWITGGITAALPDMESSSPELQRRKPEEANLIFDPQAIEAVESAEKTGQVLKAVLGDECKAKKNFMKEITEAKKQILFGLRLPEAPGDAVKLRLDGLEAMEKEYRKQCEGGQTKDYKIVFYVNPETKKDGEVFKVPVMYVSPVSGYVKYLASPYDVVAGTMQSNHPDLAPGSPAYNQRLQEAFRAWMESTDPKIVERRSRFVFLEVNSCSSLGSTLRTLLPDGPQGEQGLYYREPGIGRVTVRYGRSIIATSDVPIAQFGSVVALPQGYGGKEMTQDVIFYYDTGAISSLAINSTGHTAKDQKAYYGAMADIANASIKLQQQQEAAAKAASQSSGATAAQ